MDIAELNYDPTVTTETDLPNEVEDNKENT